MEGTKIIFCTKLVAAGAPTVLTGSKTGPDALSTSDRIPNNVDLDGDPRLLKALRSWHPGFLEWWRDMGPVDSAPRDVWLRTAVSVDRDGWATWGRVQMPEYRWGIFLAEKGPERTIGFGDHAAETAWQDVPGDCVVPLLRLIVTQGDTEPASVEQQRRLGRTAPSDFDLRGLYQVNVEEGRHLWAMAYLALRFFGKNGREEAAGLLERRSGDPDKHRILGAFNQPISTWLDYFMFTMFTDRDGKFQLDALSQSGFDPLARTCRFMLTEEAHHLWIGATGVERVVRRAAELHKSTDGDPRSAGGIDLPTIQKYINLWFSLSLDLFGGEESSNAAAFFGRGLKGRFGELRRDWRHDTDSYPDPIASVGNFEIEDVQDRRIVGRKEIPLRKAMNALLVSHYRKECEHLVGQWNKQIDEAFGESRPDLHLRLPSDRFHRHQGIYQTVFADPQGNVLTADDWETRKDEWLPNAADRAYVTQMEQGSTTTEPGTVATWIAPPTSPRWQGEMRKNPPSDGNPYVVF